MILRFQDMDEVVGRALVQRLSLMFRRPLTFASLADLAAARSDTRDVNDDAAPDLAEVGGSAYAWYRFSAEPDDGARVIRPADVALEQPGRWVRQVRTDVQAQSTRRYLVHVEFCDDRRSTKDLINDCRGKTPALYISPAGDLPQERSQTQAYHQVQLYYRLRVLTMDARAGTTARFSGEPADPSAAPGVSFVIGEVRSYLIGDNRLGLLPVLRITIGAHRPESAVGGERVLCDTLLITAHVSVDSPNDPVERRAPWQLWQELQSLTARGLPRSFVGAS